LAFGADRIATTMLAMIWTTFSKELGEISNKKLLSHVFVEERNIPSGHEAIHLSWYKIYGL